MSDSEWDPYIEAGILETSPRPSLSDLLGQ
jgi:hypothetical protein